MNLQEYLSERSPKKLPSGSVLLDPSEYNRYGDTIGIPAVAKAYDIDALYCIGSRKGIPGMDNVLYTRDKDGNPKNPSVFSI